MTICNGRTDTMFMRSVVNYLRILLLIGLGAGLMVPYLTHGTIGGSDAIKYSNGIADFVTQVRAGVFPVWIGQTEYSIFGGDFPPRFAPLLQHESALIDLLTGRGLPLFRVLNVALAVSLIGGLISGYLCLRAVMPERPWTSMALAILYGSCPGVVGLVYSQDLYMSFSTLPFLPLVFLGIVRSFELDDVISRLFMAGGLAGAWLAHPPIAMWIGFIAVATQCVRIYQLGYNTRAFLLDLIAAGIFFILAGYSFIAAQSVAAQWWMPTVNVNDLLFQIRQAFPGNWLPLPRDVPLENLQIGYGLTVIFAFTAASLFFWRRQPLQVTFTAIPAILLALVTPIPFLTGALWHLAPQAVLVITNIWPIQRLALLIALSTVFGTALLIRRQSGPQHVWFNRMMAILLLGAIVLSGFQSSRFIFNANRNAPSLSESKRMQRTENLVLSASAYGVQANPPRYASMGVMDPELEHHFLDRTTRLLHSSVVDAIEPGFGPGPKEGNRRLMDVFGGKLNANPGILDISPTFRLEPGRKYLLALEFLNHDYTGILIIRGPEFFREYRLPLSGESRAFGAGPESSHVIPLWTTLDVAEDVQLQFVPTENGHTPMEYARFARFELRPYDRKDLPVQLESFFPYRATVRSDEPVYLETPKLYVPKYLATVDGANVPVQVSPDGYVLLPIEAGIHNVTLKYVPPIALRLSYWIGLAGWLGFLTALTFKNKIHMRNAEGTRKNLS